MRLFIAKREKMHLLSEAFLVSFAAVDVVVFLYNSEQNTNTYEGIIAKQ